MRARIRLVREWAAGSAPLWEVVNRLSSPQVVFRDTNRTVKWAMDGYRMGASKQDQDDRTRLEELWPRIDE